LTRLESERLNREKARGYQSCALGIYRPRALRVCRSAHIASASGRGWHRLSPAGFDRRREWCSSTRSCCRRPSASASRTSFRILARLRRQRSRSPCARSPCPSARKFAPRRSHRGMVVGSSAIAPRLGFEIAANRKVAVNSSTHCAFGFSGTRNAGQCLGILR
jgi:hypothetical protein